MGLIEVNADVGPHHAPDTERSVESAVDVVADETEGMAAISDGDDLSVSLQHHGFERTDRRDDGHPADEGGVESASAGGG